MEAGIGLLMTLLGWVFKRLVANGAISEQQMKNFESWRDAVEKRTKKLSMTPSRVNKLLGRANASKKENSRTNSKK